MLGERIKNFVERSRFLTAAYHKVRLSRLDLDRHPPVLVYQMGKVGSSSLLHSLRALCKKTPVLHVHFLTDAGLEAGRAEYDRSGVSGLPGHFYTGQYLRQRLGTEHEKWKVITLTREPVKRNISDFFYNFVLFSESRDPADLPRARVSELVERFLERHNHDYPLIWFDRELKQSLGIDVYSKPFDFAKGFQVYSGDTAELLLLRCEDLGRSAEAGVKEFLALDEFHLESANVSADRPYYDKYKEFLSNVTLPDWYLDKMYNAKYTRHFYTPGEIAAFHRQWTGDREAS